ncbi:MAG: DUF484 family protein [Gammaproteobacteria bacterium]|uniref:DUF484 family protein n=1 Tax=Candidatus Thiopontia autotrophica TaxID=2841688 RepID=A0A8J6PBM1_9GAMM|nr:DUF484 family protein [Candidatus Thiopontia autotrophica]MBL6969318.1 DUF484 family protein [Gammaproteobacteria bacterium]
MSQHESVSHEEIHAVSGDDVAAYLEQHNDFFIDYPELLNKINVPHQSGAAVSLIERQVGQLRKENGRLNNEINTLIHVARENDALSENMHRLTLELLNCESRDGIVASLYESLRDHFGIEQVVILLPHAENEQTHKLFESLLQDSVPFCGQLDEEQRESIFGDDLEHGASVALLPLGEFGGQGLIALGSADQQYYHEKMGTHFLVQLASLVSTALRHCDGEQQ